ncbi:MAG: hypothetical protein CVV41_10900 [Candidatus Riflebacteria bacterium HGW-Riflebacteria-1]|jgi:hypothetical protein|nr:MAG: hypothetical protein CVV41_10900 [Candidatus Riflebacteria bacterium HGW-Riflebacteria-1]
MNKALAFLLIFLAQTAFAQVPEPANATFSSWLAFSQGSGKQQLFWLSEDNGSMLDGPFQGPMAFITDRKSNLWVGDSLNARVLAFDSKGKPGREYDLIRAAKEAGLASDPLLIDIVPGINGKLLVADASNNAIIEIDVRSGKSRAFMAPAAGGKFYWSQINKLHSDDQGRIYIEDVALRQTIILNSDGKPEQVLPGQLGIAVAENAQIALVAASAGEEQQWFIYTCEKPGSEMKQLARLNAENPILWISLLGYDSHNTLHVVYDTRLARHYISLDSEGRITRKHTTTLQDPGYDVNRPDWIDKSGKIYTLQVNHPALRILKLE